MNQPWKVIIVLVGIFVAGGLTGAFVMIRMGREMALRRPLPEQWAPMQLKRLVERLDLRPEQQEQIRPVVRRNMEELNRLRAYAMAETKTVMERMEREVSEKLTPEQRAKFDQMNRELREAREAREKAARSKRANGGHPPGERPPGDQPPPPGKPPGN